MRYVNVELRYLPERSGQSAANVAPGDEVLRRDHVFEVVSGAPSYVLASMKQFLESQGVSGRRIDVNGPELTLALADAEVDRTAGVLKAALIAAVQANYPGEVKKHELEEKRVRAVKLMEDAWPAGDS